MNRKLYRGRNYDRRRPYLSLRERVLIVCEGEKTEPNYFKSLKKELKLTAVEVEIEGKMCGSAPISVVDYALSLKKDAKRSPIKTEYDVIWCVIDVEAPTPHQSLDRAMDKSKANGLKIALSNPCFEYWYLLHFKKTSALMDSNEKVVKALRRYYHAYKKNDIKFFDVIYSKVDFAITNAKLVIKEKHYGKDLRNCNPSTDVHKIVEHLRDIAKKAFPAAN